MPLFLTLIVSILSLVPGIAFAQELDVSAKFAELEEMIAGQQTNSDHIWTMTAMVLVFMMQAGFLLLEAGMTRTKNSISVAEKNLVDFLLAMMLFYIMGFAVMFGTSHGLFGWDNSLSFFSQSDDWTYTFFLFQAVFAGTAGTIVSGAVAERMQFAAYVWITAIIAIFIYPVIGHWGWGNLLNGDNETFLTKMGFIDYAGSTIVHSVGAWVALAAIIILGPRSGRFDKDGKANRMEGHSLVLSTMGCLILWVGWVGFNGGSTTAGTPDFAHIIFNTMIAATFGGVTAFFVGKIMDGHFRPDAAINGILGGLVAITAGCDAVAGHGAAIIGASAGIVMYFAGMFLERILKLDDVVGAIPVHGFCGAWGTLMVAFFATEEKLGGATRSEQFIAQAAGVGAAFAWAFGVAFILIYLLNKVVKIRVSPEAEKMGLNTSEHGTTLGTGLLQERLKEIVFGDGDLTKRVATDTGDESAELGWLFNKFVERVQGFAIDIKKNAGELGVASQHLSGVASGIAENSENMREKSDTVSRSASDMSSKMGASSEVVNQVSADIQEISSSSHSISKSIAHISQAIAELNGSILEVSGSAENANKISTKASELSGTASSAIERLTKATGNIDEFVTTIQEISDKTNLLALNAMIESARAGEAGKSFAVVAQEVKALSDSTAKATQEIYEQVSDIKNSNGQVLDIINDIIGVIDTIGQSINDINLQSTAQREMAQMIASEINQSNENVHLSTASIEKISAASQDISKDVNFVAQSSVEMAQSLGTFTEGTKHASENAETLKKSAVSLDTMAKTLQDSVSRFKTE